MDLLPWKWFHLLCLHLIRSLYIFLITNSEFYFEQAKCLIIDKEVPFQLLWLYLHMGRGKNNSEVGCLCDAQSFCSSWRQTLQGSLVFTKSEWCPSFPTLKLSSPFNKMMLVASPAIKFWSHLCNPVFASKGENWGVALFIGSLADFCSPPVLCEGNMKLKVLSGICCMEHGRMSDH